MLTDVRVEAICAWLVADAIAAAAAALESKTYLLYATGAIACGLFLLLWAKLRESR